MNRCQALFFAKAHKILLIALFLSLAPHTGFSKEADKVNFHKKTITLGSQKLLVEIAETQQELEYGLMFREKLKDDEGMLFIFESERALSFWMKNTLIPLSIGYFDQKKKLFEIKDMEPASSIDKNPQLYPSKKPAMYALEVPKGWFERKKIKPGAILKFEK